MPKKTGYEVISETPKNIKEKTKFYAFTADLMVESIEKYKKSGFVGTISKPIDIENLKSILS